MAPSQAPGRDRAGREEEEGWEALGGRKARKPLVEKKRRARINESLQELRLLLAGTEVGPGLALRGGLGRAHSQCRRPLHPPWGAEREQLQAEASERFAAGYIRCMHEVHTFVSTCQAIDATVSAELLNHLLESMPLRDGSGFRDLLGDATAAPPGAAGSRGWPAGGVPGSPLSSPPRPGDDLYSDLEEVSEAELSRAPAEGLDWGPTALGGLTAARMAQSVWRPW
ncbi:PREDICTED: transcription cofactor HES-6 [Dipodomys ordii]|uniref:Transcription cofactor HES-6 n=1 Tax=Dipodomys ordii TaxID=10020 RepID=A0A1S3ENH4_DIPOR|nr:PREDICTED: transcription cofactor HES-6 [Dipodomys ordii]